MSDANDEAMNSTETKNADNSYEIPYDSVNELTNKKRKRRETSMNGERSFMDDVEPVIIGEVITPGTGSEKLKLKRKKLRQSDRESANTLDDTVSKQVVSRIKETVETPRISENSHISDGESILSQTLTPRKSTDRLREKRNRLRHKDDKESGNNLDDTVTKEVMDNTQETGGISMMSECSHADDYESISSEVFTPRKGTVSKLKLKSGEKQKSGEKRRETEDAEFETVTAEAAENCVVEKNWDTSVEHVETVCKKIKKVKKHKNAAAESIVEGLDAPVEVMLDQSGLDTATEVVILDQSCYHNDFEMTVNTKAERKKKGKHSHMTSTDLNSSVELNNVKIKKKKKARGEKKKSTSTDEVEKNHVSSTDLDETVETDGTADDVKIRKNKKARRKNVEEENNHVPSTDLEESEGMVDFKIDKNTKSSRKKKVGSTGEESNHVTSTDLDTSEEMDRTVDVNKTKSPNVNYSTPNRFFQSIGTKSARLTEFKSYNCVSFTQWQKIGAQLREQGKSYTTGRFSADENRQLKKNWEKLTKSCPFEEPHVLLLKNYHPHIKKEIEEYITASNFFVKLGKHINRPLYSIYNRARKLFHPGNFRGEYTEEEIATMKKLRLEHGNKWMKIGQLMERSGQSLIDRNKVLKKHLLKGRWTEEEEEQLAAAVKKHIGDDYETKNKYFNLPWTDIARDVPTRNLKQCREHWLHCLAFGKEKRDMFSNLQKIRLIQEIQDQHVSHDCEIDWLELKGKFDVPSPQFLQYQWRSMRHLIPNWERFPFAEVLERVKEELIPELRKILEQERLAESERDNVEIAQDVCPTENGTDIPVVLADSDFETGISQTPSDTNRKKERPKQKKSKSKKHTADSNNNSSPTS